MLICFPLCNFLTTYHFCMFVPHFSKNMVRGSCIICQTKYANISYGNKMFVYLKKKEFKLLYKNDEAKRYVLIYAVYYIHKQYNFFFLCMLKCIFSKIFTISFYSHLAVVFPSTVSLCPLPSFPYSLFEMIHLFYFSRFCLWKCFRLFYNGSRNFVIFNVNHYEQKINFVLIVMYNVPHKTVTKLSTIRLWFLKFLFF